MTIRTRLTFLYSSLLAIVILMFSAATSSILNWTLRNNVDSTLLDVAEEVHGQIGKTIIVPLSSTSNPANTFRDPPADKSMNASNVYWQLWLHNTTTNDLFLQSWNLVGMNYDEALDPVSLDRDHEVRRDVIADGAHLRVVTIPLVANGQIYGHIQVAQSLRTVDAAIDRLLKIMLIGGAIVLLASLMLGDMLSQRALKPIDTITQAARRITAADDLSRRIPYDGPPDEIGQLTETFNDTLERLERLFKAQRRFVADVSHEMRTPLTTIQGNLDLMRRIGMDTEAMEAIEGEAARMSRLVGDLLLLAKADAGRLTLDKAVVELDTLILEVYNQAHLLNESDTTTVELGQIDQVQVLGDVDRLKQLVLNLLSNAIKYTPEGKVTLSLSQDEKMAYVTVTDTGIGISEEDLSHVFDRFYRVDPARPQGGTGLGLSIAKWIADAHGGQISVVSKVGEGSTFTLSLPVKPDQPVPPESLHPTHPNMHAIRLTRPR